MTAVLDIPGPDRLAQLYGRYKALALAAGASMLIDAPDERLRLEVDGLVDDCRSAAAGAGALEPQLTACAAAAVELGELLAGDASEAEIERVRASHRTLRRTVWSVLPCEYVPCCAEQHVHHHR